MNEAMLYADYQRYVDLLVKHNPRVIVGFDETGNGAIAGPLCVGACALSLDFADKVRDSKRYSSERARKKAYELVINKSKKYKAFMAMTPTIENIGHGAALNGLYKEALEDMYAEFGDDGLYILDGNKRVQNTSVPHVVLVKADDFIPAVSAASIVAKFERDKILKDVEFMPWRFDKSKGYPTPEHLERLDKLGPIKGFHRMNVDRVKKAFDKNGWYQKENDKTNRED